MLITNHVLAGALIGFAARRRPFVAALVGCASHFVLDSMPHWGTDDEQRFNRVAIVDGIGGLAVIGLIARTVPRARRFAVLAGIFGSCLPDLDKPADMFYSRSPFPEVVDRFHAAVQREAPHRLPQEVRVAGALAAALAAAVAVSGVTARLRPRRLA
ncbi:MAG: hypothetical protein ACRDV3_13415 [Acidothermaceae bacterium]